MKTYACDTSDGRTVTVRARDAFHALRLAENETGFYCRNPRRAIRERRKHTVCKAGAAVRLHGYAPARVLYLEHERRGPDYSTGTWWAHCVITARGPDWKAGRIGPHGYRPGEAVTVRACEAVPRDLIRVARGSGRLWWPAFAIGDA